MAKVKGHEYQYLQVVESCRQGPKVRQRVVANLGRLDRLLDSGQLENIVNGLARFSEAYKSYRAFVEGRFDRCLSRLWGPPLVFGRLWERQKLPEVLGGLAEGRKFQFDVERAAFAMALHRLCHPGSDLQCSQWVRTVEAPGFDSLQLQHFYRTCSFLAEVRDDLERELFFKDRDLFSQELDLVFLDTTSTYVYRDTETEMRKRGYSRDRHPQLPQFVLCVAVDRHGWPMAWEIYPGNTADKKAFERIIAVFRQRLQVRRVMVVADRGMISKDTIRLLTDSKDAPFDYIMGCRLRQDKEVSEVVLSRGGRYRKVAGNLEVKEVTVGDDRYIVCHNPEEAQKDAAARQAILAKLEATLSHGPKSVIGNKGFKRFLKVRKGAVSIDAEAVKREARLDGKFVLRTNTALSAEEVAATYKSLWRVERVFRQEKSTLEIRPIYHHRDDTSMGHIVASFLALRLELDLQRRLEQEGVDVSWPDLVRDLSGVQAVHIELDGRSFVIRTDLGQWAAKALAAAGIRSPSRISESMTECSA
ncbi:MAG: IS1634 family transposase [Candidatus Zixiibacteriota bacterium]